MEFYTKQSLHRNHGISNIAVHRKSWSRRVRVALMRLGRAAAEFYRTRRDHEFQLRMSEAELRDIGLHRVESAAGVHIVSFGDAG